ncbi:MAG: amidohydrolase family protein [Armatimonadetes bacterium]|nr:amidohydrolase family protein [Armatimonadota bacterium]
MTAQSGAGGLLWFDCNARIGPWSTPRPEQITDLPGLLVAWDEVGIQRGLVHHALAWDWHAPEGNRRLLAEIAGNERVSPCLVALPPATREMGPIEEFAAQAHELRGAVRIFPAKHSWRLTDWGSGALFEALNDQRVPVFVDFGETDWDELYWLAAAHPDMPVVLMGSYYRVARYLYPLMERCPNFHIEANTYGAFRGIEDVVEVFGAERLLFGTGLPDLEPGAPIAQITYAEVSDADKALMASGNLLRILSGGE